MLLNNFVAAGVNADKKHYHLNLVVKCCLILKQGFKRF